jgi:hypothetical protein
MLPIHANNYGIVWACMTLQFLHAIVVPGGVCMQTKVFDQLIWSHFYFLFSWKEYIWMRFLNELDNVLTCEKVLYWALTSGFCSLIGFHHVYFSLSKLYVYALFIGSWCLVSTLLGLRSPYWCCNVFTIQNLFVYWLRLQYISPHPKSNTSSAEIPTYPFVIKLRKGTEQS